MSLTSETTRPAAPPHALEGEKAGPPEVPESLIRQPLRRPSLGVVLGQARRDYFGKDVQQTTTYSYTWSADQSGHFMLGFAPTFLIFWAFAVLHTRCGVSTWYSGPDGLLWAAASVMVVWLGVELWDLYDSLRKIARSTGHFRPNTANLIWNVVTALFYFATGAVVAGMSSSGPEYAVAAVLILFVVQFPIAVWWLRRKIIFQQAGLPYLYRLPNYDGEFDLAHGTAAAERDESAARARVEGFINSLTAPPANRMETSGVEHTGRRHLIVCGPQNSGKTSLGVGIGTEFAFNGGIGRYITMSDLVQIVSIRADAALAQEAARAGAPPAVVSGLARSAAAHHGSLPSGHGRSPVPEDNEFNDGRVLWKWASVDLLVIDDVIELLLPVRRAIERRLAGEGLQDEMEHELLQHHRTLVERLGGVEKVREILVEPVAGEITKRLRFLTSPEVIAKYVAASFGDVIGAIRRIPRVVWVLGNMIRPDLFEEFIRKEFELDRGGPTAGNLLVLQLQPPPGTSTTPGEAVPASGRS